MRESEIRPADIHEEYLRLSAEDARTFFPDPRRYVSRACPACGDPDSRDGGFEKHGFRLARCKACDTLFVTAIPGDTELDAFYRDSKSQRFWSETFFPTVAEARREKIFRPRVEKIGTICREAGIAVRTVIDAGAGTGTFLEECRTAGLGTRWQAIEPSRPLAEKCRAKGLETFEGTAAQAVKGWTGSADLVVSFEVVEHVSRPVDFLHDLGVLACPGGLIVVTGPGGSGFDVRVLGPDSKVVGPPHHLNYFSPKGAEAAVRRAGLELQSYLTPGLLDVDIVRNTWHDTPEKLADPFLHSLVFESDEATRDAFQAFLSAHGLSSHMWIVARRP